jgi:protein gp37
MISPSVILKGTSMVEIVNGTIGLKYGFVKPSWNPIVGCSHACSYCWARYQHPRQLNRRYFKRNFSEPELVYKNVGLGKLTEELDHIKRNSWVFVCDMGDLFCKNDIVKRKDIQRVFEMMKRREDLTYLVVTKNPKRYFEFIGQFPKNTYLGTTIETNRNKTIRRYSKAPSTYCRYKAMKKLQHERKFLALEPLFNFDLKTLHNWIIEINPEIIAIGFDEHPRTLKHTKPDRPPLEKIIALLSKLKKSFKCYPEKRIYLTGEVAEIYFRANKN